MDGHSSGFSWGLWGILLGVAIVIGGGTLYFLVFREDVSADETSSPARENRGGIKVETTMPKQGGIPRLVTQPGSVEPFDGAALYAKVYGQLKTLKVDIGSRVKKGELLAEILIPEREAKAERDKSRVEDANAKLKQAEAQKIEAEAAARAANASVELATIMVKVKTAYKQYREKQLNRVKDLVARKAEDQRLQDEQEDFYLSAVEAENAAREKVLAEKERAEAAQAKIQRVEADIAAAKADILVAKADLAESQVWVEYGKITSPYDGVITQRGYLPGDFIKTGDQSGSQPIVTVVSTEVMRVVIPVPDRDVPYIEPGQQAILTFDALPDLKFQTTADSKVVVSRLAHAEDYSTRLMRVEVDLQNKDGKVKVGMYGRATLILNKGAEGAVHIPSAALSGRANEGKGTVRVVRDGKIQTIPVKYGMDDGVNVEILSGLSLQDQVVTGTNVPVADGTAVNVNQTK